MLKTFRIQLYILSTVAIYKKTWVRECVPNVMITWPKNPQLFFKEGVLCCWYTWHHFTALSCKRVFCSDRHYEWLIPQNMGIKKWGKGWCTSVNLYAVGDFVFFKVSPSCLHAVVDPVCAFVLTSVCSLQTSPRPPPPGSFAGDSWPDRVSISPSVLPVCQIVVWFQWKCLHSANLPLRRISAYAPYLQTLLTVACLASR